MWLIATIGTNCMSVTLHDLPLLVSFIAFTLSPLHLNTTLSRHALNSSILQGVLSGCTHKPMAHSHWCVYRTKPFHIYMHRCFEEVYTVCSVFCLSFPLNELCNLYSNSPLLRRFNERVAAQWCDEQGTSAGSSPSVIWHQPYSRV